MLAASAPASAIGTGICITTHESSRQTHGPDNKNSNGSRDRGLWQINDKAHPDVSDDVAYDPALATAAARQISNNWTDWSPWTTYSQCRNAPAYHGTPTLDGVSATTTGSAGLAGSKGTVNNAIDSVTNPINAIVGFIARLFEPSFWLRVGKGLAGFLLMAFGAITLMKVLLGVDIPIAPLAGKAKSLAFS
jgi:hypothetical protein